MEYLQNHRIEGVLETIVNDVLADQPQNPFQVMAERLAAAAGGSKGGTAAPKALAKQARKAAHAPDAGDSLVDVAALSAALLSALEAGPVADSQAYAAQGGIDHQVLVDRVIKKLQSGEKIVTEKMERQGVELTADGKTAAASGSPECLVWALVPATGTSKKDLEARLSASVVKAGLGQAIKLKWLRIDKASKNILRADGAEVPADTVQTKLQAVSTGATLNAADLKELSRRKLIAKTKSFAYKISPGPKFGVDENMGNALTVEMLRTGEWKTLKFKPYNLDADAKLDPGGFLHPLMKVRTQFREVFLELGFEEMPTDRFVESSFWNFDTLFQPQAHPARDSHDTFFVKGDAALTSKLPSDYLKTVQDTHQTGGNTGSIGYRNEWKEDEARKNLLRTHTTAISSRMLYRVAQELKSTGEFRSRKFFSVDRVFRNETMDATHLCEFHQVEGVVLDYNLTLGDLMGTIQTFCEKIGLTGCRFKPAYNPYTEPSMEIFSYHPDLKKWVEVGNSGMFRPEMMLPYPLPPDVRAIAWGLSLERPTMILYGINNIRTLMGHEVSLDMIRSNPICRMTV